MPQGRRGRGMRPCASTLHSRAVDDRGGGLDGPERRWGRPPAGSDCRRAMATPAPLRRRDLIRVVERGIDLFEANLPVLFLASCSSVGPPLDRRPTGCDSGSRDAVGLPARRARAHHPLTRCDPVASAAAGDLQTAAVAERCAILIPARGERTCSDCPAPALQSMPRCDDAAGVPTCAG